jgi:hypothetical protein
MALNFLRILLIDSLCNFVFDSVPHLCALICVRRIVIWRLCSDGISFFEVRLIRIFVTICGWRLPFCFRMGYIVVFVSVAAIPLGTLLDNSEEFRGNAPSAGYQFLLVTCEQLKSNQTVSYSIVLLRILRYESCPYASESAST